MGKGDCFTYIIVNTTLFLLHVGCSKLPGEGGRPGEVRLAGSHAGLGGQGNKPALPLIGMGLFYATSSQFGGWPYPHKAITAASSANSTQSSVRERPTSLES